MEPRRWQPLVIILSFLLAPTACITSSPPQRLTDLKLIVGSWNGTVGCRECPTRFRAYLSVRDDGQWQVTVEQNPAYYGTMAVVSGELRWGQGGRWIGPVLFVEERGRQYLTLARDNGSVWTEFDRAK